MFFVLNSLFHCTFGPPFHDKKDALPRVGHKFNSLLGISGHIYHGYIDIYMLRSKCNWINAYTIRNTPPPSGDTKVISLISFRPAASCHLWPSHVAISGTALHKKTIKVDVKFATCAMGGFFLGWLYMYTIWVRLKSNESFSSHAGKVSFP